MTSKRDKRHSISLQSSDDFNAFIGRGFPDQSIQLFIDDNVKAFGDVVSAVRVRPTKPTIRQAVKCADCGCDIRGAAGRGADYMANYTAKKFGVPLCFECAEKRAAEESAKHEQEGGNDDGQTSLDC